MDMTLLTKATNSFGLDLFKTLFDSREGNIFISPFSISAALAMLQAGARETTATNMARALRWPSVDANAQIKKQFQTYISMLQQPSDLYQLSTATRIYIEKTCPILKEFLTEGQTHYFAEPLPANFSEKADAECKKINDWIEEQTHGKIKNMLSKGSLDPLTKMLIVNAIYFKGKWASQFREMMTTPTPFKLAPGQTKRVKTMFQPVKLAYLEDQQLDCSVVDFPYKGEDLSMVIFLPHEDFGLDKLVKNLTAEKLISSIEKVGKISKEKVLFFLPKFTIETGYSLTGPLSALGMGDAFSASQADFSGITGTREIYVSQVAHRAFIKVNEEGTEAAAVTVAAAKGCSPMGGTETPQISGPSFPVLYRGQADQWNRLVSWTCARC